LFLETTQRNLLHVIWSLQYQSEIKFVVFSMWNEKDL
jgi:hypothetical protein